MIYNLVFTMIGLCFVLMLLVSLFLKRRNDSIRSKVYRLLIISSLLYGIADIISIYTLVYSFESKKFLSIIWNFRNSCVFVYVIAFLWYYKAATKNYQYKNLFELFIKNKLFLFSFIYIFAAVILSTFKGRLPKITPDNISFTTTADVIPVMIFIILFSLVGFISSIKYKNTNKKIFNCFLLIFILSVCLVPLQLYFHNVSIQPFVSMFMLYVIYHYIENPDIDLLEEVSELKVNIDSSSNSKTEFLFKLSNDLLLPINTIVSLSESLNSLNSVDQEKVKFDLNNIKYAGSVLLESMDNIINSSNDNNFNTLKEYRFYDLIKKIKSVINSRIGFKKITFDVSFDDNISSKLFGEEEKIQNILLNILSNAVKYTEVGKINFNVTSSLNGDIQTLHFKISDTGCGIKEEEKSFIFSSTSDAGGMGLSLCKSYIESMNGMIRFESTYGVGTTFYVDVPQKVVGSRLVSEDRVDDNTDTKIEYTDLSKYKVLIVDDDELDIKVVKRLMENYNIQFFSLNSTVEFIDKIKIDEEYDIVFLDHKMPILDGVDTVKALRQLESYSLPKMVCLTANASSGASEYYKSVGFDDYLAKPLDRYELDRILKKYLK